MCVINSTLFAQNAFEEFRRNGPESFNVNKTRGSCQVRKIRLLSLSNGNTCAVVTLLRIYLSIYMRSSFNDAVKNFIASEESMVKV